MMAIHSTPVPTLFLKEEGVSQRSLSWQRMDTCILSAVNKPAQAWRSKAVKLASLETALHVAGNESP